jgi:hypothetical protein
MLEDDMTQKSALLFRSGCVAMLLASLLAAPQVFAQQPQQQAGGRDAALVKCIAETRKQFTGDTEDMQRADWYKACMARAGFQP